MPFNTSFTVPSPPAATIKSYPSPTASAASRRASPGAAVAFNAHCRADGVKLAAEMPRLVAAGRRIEDDAGWHKA